MTIYAKLLRLPFFISIFIAKSIFFHYISDFPFSLLNIISKDFIHVYGLPSFFVYMLIVA